MGKVKKLRKKYRALCIKNNSGSLKNNENLKNNNFIVDSDNRSNSISGSIRSTFSTTKMLKKNKQRLRHELFLKSEHNKII